MLVLRKKIIEKMTTGYRANCFANTHKNKGSTHCLGYRHGRDTREEKERLPEQSKIELDEKKKILVF